MNAGREESCVGLMATRHGILQSSLSVLLYSQVDGPKRAAMSNRAWTNIVTLRTLFL